MSRDQTLHAGFLASVARVPDRPALEAGGEILTYAELHGRALGLGAALAASDAEPGSPLTGVFAYRTPTAYAGLLAALLRGHGYVPLSRRHPPERTRLMIGEAGLREMIVDAASARRLDELLPGLPAPMSLVIDDEAAARSVAERWPEHRVLGPSDLRPDGWTPDGSPSPADLAYVLFTSGSTGTPKGVMVEHRSGAAFVEMMADRYAVTETDRWSQLYELTFDPSVMDMFVAWGRGACVCSPTANELVKPDGYVRRSNLTVWSSVPSTAVLMRRLGLLQEGAFPGVRLSVFIGEALPLEVTRVWQDAAPASRVENIYGPTEATVAVTGYRWDGARSPDECRNGIVPIGRPFPGVDVLVVDDALRPVADGEPGELLLGGPQLARGYWNDAEKTASAFIVPPGRSERFYRTGDRVAREAPDAPIQFLGRLDHQIKVRGHRVELGEIEAALRAASGEDAVVAVGWPRTASGADGVAAFIGNPGVDVAAARAELVERLPEYMVPGEIRALPRLPLNVSGKYDRGELVRILESE